MCSRRCSVRRSERTAALRVASRVLGTILLLGYPIAVWVGLSMASNRLVALALLAVLGISLLSQLLIRRRQNFREFAFSAMALSVLALLAVLLDDRRFLLSTPALVNATLLMGFGTSLFAGRVPAVERFARMYRKDLSPERVMHCRSVTKVWCLFFLINGLASLALALFAPISVWTIYVGVVSYMLMGALFAGEYTVRKIRFG